MEERITLTLDREGLLVPGLDRTLAWADIADLDMSANHTGITTRVLLFRDAPWPCRRPGGRSVKLDEKRRIVTFGFGLPRGMRLQDFADLIGRYRSATEARRILAETKAALPHGPEVPAEARMMASIP